MSAQEDHAMQIDGPAVVTVRISIPSSEKSSYTCPTPTTTTLRQCALEGIEHADKKTWNKRLERYGGDTAIPLFLVKEVQENEFVHSFQEAFSNGFELLAASVKQETDDAQSIATVQRARRSGGSSVVSPNGAASNGPANREFQQAAVTVLRELMTRVPTIAQSNSSLTGAAGPNSVQLNSPEAIGIALLQAMLQSLPSSGVNGQAHAQSSSAQPAVSVTVNTTLTGTAGSDASGLSQVRDCLQEILDAIRQPSNHQSQSPADPAASGQNPPRSFSAIGAQISEAIARLSTTAGGVVADALSRSIETSARTNGFAELGQEIRQSRFDHDIRHFQKEVRDELKAHKNLLSTLRDSISTLISRLPEAISSDSHVRTAPPSSPPISASLTSPSNPGSAQPSLTHDINISHAGSAGSRSATRTGTDEDFSDNTEATDATRLVQTNRDMAQQQGQRSEHNFSATGAAGSGAYTQHS